MGEVEVSPPKEPLVAPKVQERPVDIPRAVSPPETAPEPVARAVAKEPVKPPIDGEIVAEHPPSVGVAEEETRLMEEPALAVAPEITARTAPGLRRALPWAAAGIAAVVLSCIGAVVALYVAGPALGVSPSTLQLSFLCPGSLLLVSGASFAGAGLLLGVLLWARRGSIT
jgi:hypothetical protein